MEIESCNSGGIDERMIFPADKDLLISPNSGYDVNDLVGQGCYWWQSDKMFFRIIISIVTSIKCEILYIEGRAPELMPESVDRSRDLEHRLFFFFFNGIFKWGIPRIELGTSCTLSENHTTTPNALFLKHRH